VSYAQASKDLEGAPHWNPHVPAGKRPKGATQRSLRAMGKEIGHAPSTIRRLWGAFGLQPLWVETFRLSSDLLFVEKVRDIVGLYLSPRFDPLKQLLSVPLFDRVIILIRIVE
jgi:hypothetical protein